jgi:hypothetical protein
MNFSCLPIIFFFELQSDFATTSHPRAFYLSKPDGSSNSWMSDSGTGIELHIFEVCTCVF